MQTYSQTSQTCQLSSGEKERAYRLIKDAIRKWNNGETEIAEKLLNKAESIYPTSKAKEILRTIRTKVQKTNRYDNKGGQSLNQASGVKPRSSLLDYTPQQFKAVQRIIGCNNYYDVLNVRPTASYDDIKEAYKKLALLVHPDKNKAANAKEAFQALVDAKHVLTDPAERKKYDNMKDNNQFEKIVWAVVGGVALVVVGVGASFFIGGKSKKDDKD